MPSYQHVTKNTGIINTITPQTQPIRGKKMVKNNAGGYGFEVDKWQQLERFLILGTEGGTYYVKESKLAVDNVDSIITCIAEDGQRVVRTVVEVSDSGRAAKNDYALVVLALCMTPKYADLATRQYACNEFKKVVRTGTHLLHFVDIIENYRGWGGGLRRVVADWFIKSTPANLAYQAIKYQNRDGWTLRDVVRLSHPYTTDEALNRVIKYIADGNENTTNEPVQPIIDAIGRINAGTNNGLTISELCNLIIDHRLPREAIPTQFLNDVNVWNALLVNMPVTAMIRNLGKMSSIGLIKPLSDASKKVVAVLHDQQSLSHARIHPMAILVALKTYIQGHGYKGSLTWNVDQNIAAALEDAYYLTFNNVEPSGKRVMIGVDVSGSMSGYVLGNIMRLSEAAACMAMTIVRTEPTTYVHGFCHTFIDLGINQHTSLSDACSKTLQNNFGSTDCSIPMLYAAKQELDVDCFIIITDNDTWCGKIHPVEALRCYNEKTGLHAKCIVVGMTANNISIADPTNPNMLDVVGFDTNIPMVINNFMKL